MSKEPTVRAPGAAPIDMANFGALPRRPVIRDIAEPQIRLVHYGEIIEDAHRAA